VRELTTQFRLFRLCSLVSVGALVLSLFASTALAPALFAQPAPSASPRVTKVEPPNWWIGLSPEVMLLLSGENLDGATVSCDTPGVTITKSKVTAAGRYMFIWAAIGNNASVGTAKFHLHSASGETAFDLPLLQRASPDGRYQGFSEDDVMYLIMPDRFADGDPSNNDIGPVKGVFDRSAPRAYHGGDLRGIQNHLGYLSDLGVTTIWLTPIVDNADDTGRDYHGYGAVVEYAVEEHLGTLADLQSLTAAAHKNGLKLILDFVPNHIGPTHPWAALPPEPDWFNGTREHHTASTGDFQYVTDPHAPEKFWHDVEDGWFGNILPDMNQNNPDVARYFIQNALWWAEQTGIDGYRLDTFPYVSRAFWSEWHRALKQAYPQMTTVGEVLNRDPSVVSFFAGGRAQFDGIDSRVSSLFDYPMYFATREGLLAAGNPKRVVDTLASDQLYPSPDRLVTIVGNHDMPRLAGIPGITPGQIRLAFSIVLTLRGIPQLYYGDEIGIQGGDDPDNRRDFPGGFPGDARNAFLASGRTTDEQALYSYVQALLKLRRDHVALREGALWQLHWDDSTYSFARVARNERLVVVLNAGPSAKTLRFSLAETPVADASRVTRIFGDPDAAIQGGEFIVSLKPHDFAVYSIQ
jgi:glycosidase